MDRAEEIGAHLDKEPVSDETVQAVEKVYPLVPSSSGSLAFESRAMTSADQNCCW